MEIACMTAADGNHPNSVNLQDQRQLAMYRMAAIGGALPDSRTGLDPVTWICSAVADGSGRPARVLPDSTQASPGLPRPL
jgi:hypothetical protein